jgi:PEP-CTERM motif
MEIWPFSGSMNLTKNNEDVIMKLAKSLVVLALAVFTGATAMGAFAAPTFPVQDAIVSIEKNPTPLGTTAIADPFGLTTGVGVSSIAYGGGTINLGDLYNNPLITANPTSPDWWYGTGVVYTTTTNTINITFTNLLVNAFTFKLGANKAASGWIRAYYETDAGPATLTTAPGNFAISPTESHTYGVYVKQPTVSCAVITRIEIEPTFVWGVGDFGISTGGCTEVPEPNSLTLFGIGMLVLGLAFYGPRRRLQIEQV